MHTICSCRNAVFLGLHTRTRPSTGVNNNNFHPISALSATTWYSTPYGHVPIKAWLFCGVLSVEDALARNFVLVRRLLRVRLLMRLLTIHRLRSVFAVLNGHCLASLLRSLSSFGIVFRGFPDLFPFFYTSGLVHALLQSNNDRVASLNRSAVFMQDIPPLTMPTACHLSASDSFRCAILNKSLQSLKFYLYCTCRYWFETPAKLEFCKGTGELIKTCFVVL